MNYKTTILKTAIGASLLTCAAAAHSANWLMLQGTEPAGESPRAKVWGFVQPEYQSTDGTLLQAGPWKDEKAVFNQVVPGRQTDSNFVVRRARLGVRGTAMPIDPKVNYFLLAEFGNNGITKPGGGSGSAKVSDASITLNHIPGARIRAGLFKTPGSEEGLQAIHVFDYINFTNVTFGLTFERYYAGDGSGTYVKPGTAAGTASNTGDPNNPISPVGAFRDTGIQVFDTFKVNDWEHSYAVMYGNGNGINGVDNDDNKDTYLYWASEWVFGGQGPRRDGWKLFAWQQDGKRTLTNPNEGAGEYDRTRKGLGTTFRKDKYRAAFEYITADGMIDNGTDGGAQAGAKTTTGIGKFGTNPNEGPCTATDCTVVASHNMEVNGEADGWYGHFGYLVHPKVELDVRYDVFNRMTNVSAAERKYETVTLGAQYFFNKKSRLIVNYEFKSAEAPNLPASDNANKILDGMDDVLAAQLLVVF